ncbi:MAG: phosphate ABC transporter substrate-binding/OmpA family protein [Litoreibacter sp.]
MLTVSLRNKTKTALVAGLMATSFMPAAAFAESDVTLKSSDGSINLFGELVEFDDEFYVLKTGLGTLRISSARVRCDGDACPTFETADADVEISGSEAVGVGLMPLLMEGYAASVDAEPSIASTSQQGQIVANLVGDQGFGDDLGSYLVTASNTSKGFEGLLKSEAHITMASRRILPAEARALRQAGAGNMISPNQEHIVAIDSIVVVTHPSNPVQSLTMQQVSDIYAGDITNWSQVGGPDLSIEVVGRDDQSDIRAVFNTRVRGDAAATQASNAVLAADHNEAAALVTERPGAIGYVGYAFLRGAKPISLVNECNIAMIPDSFSSKTEEYALQRRMYLYNRADQGNELSTELLNYATSEAADHIILKSGFIDLGIERRDQSQDSERAQSLLERVYDSFEAKIVDEMLTEMTGYDRLSTTFRFRTGSSALDERGQLDIKRLANYLENSGDDTEILLVGFTDDVGAFSANHKLSIDRASQIVSELQSKAKDKLTNVKVRATGFGEISPAACNVSDQGRAINRRVEVWIKSNDA